MSWWRMRTLMLGDFAVFRRRALFWVWGFILLVVAWLFGDGSLSIVAGDSSVGGAKAWVTSEFANAHLFALGTLLFHGFFVAIVCGLPIIRDEAVRIGDILHTTPLRKSEYIWGKFAAALAACLLMLGVNVVFAIFFNHALPTSTPGIRGPLAVAHYLTPIVILAVPTVVFIAGVAFALGTSSGRAVTVFVLPVALLLLCGFFLWGWSPPGLSPSMNTLLMLLDPTGFRWLEQTYLDVDRGVAYYNHVRIAWSPALLISRFGWVAIGLLAVALVSRNAHKASAAVTTMKRARLAQEHSNVQAGAAPSPAGDSVSALGMGQSVPSAWRSSWMLVRCELRGLARQGGIYLFVPVILLTIIPGAVSENGPFDSALLPTPGFLAQKCMTGLLTCTTLLLLFYSVESLERDSRARIDPILNATPTSGAAIVLGRLLANALLGMAVMLVAWVACVAVMFMRDVPSKSAVPFLLLWGVCGVPTIVAWTALVGMIWAKTRNRYATYGVGLLLVMATGWLFVKGKASWLTNWALWGSVMWSDISVLEADRTILILNRLFVFALGILFLRIAVLFYRQSEGDRLATPAFWKQPKLKPLLRLAPFWLPALGLGIAVWGCMESGHQSEEAKRRAKDYWKQNVSTFKDAPTPDMMFVDLDVELDPASGTMSVRGEYTLENGSPSPMRRILLTTGQHMQSPTFTLNGTSHTPEDRSDLRVFTLDSPLAPNESMRVGFAYSARLPDGASAKGGELAEFILPSGVMLSNLHPTFVPVLGFRDEIGVDEDNRAEERIYEPDFYEGMTPPAMAGTGAPFRTKIRITTPADFVANSVGTKTGDRLHDGKRTVVWESDQPVYIFNVVAGRWAVLEAADTEVYYDPRHSLNVSELSLALQSARKYYSEWFYPFPWKTLKLSEFPGLDRSALGFPTNIAFSENMGFFADPSGDDNLVFWITAHEAAHQWWPNLVIPAKGPGAPVLSESLSHFSAMLLLEAVKGEDARIDFAQRIEHRYGKARVADAEQPLTLVDESGHREGRDTVWYDRGGWAFWMLMQTMGRAEMFSGLHAYVEKYRGNPDHPALHDLFEVLRPHAQHPQAFADCIAQWFEAVTLPRFEFVSATKEQNGASWQVRGRLRNAGTGRVTVDVAVATGERSSKTSAATDTPYRETRTRVSLTAGGDADFSIDADFLPERVVVDPDVMVLQLGRNGATMRL
jgi:ABC-2 type transport system permease protein